MSIRLKLLVPFLVLPLLALALLGGIAYRSGREAITASLGRLFELQALRGIEALDREAAALRRTAEAWASLDVLQDVVTEDLDGRISSFLVAQRRASEALERALVVDRTGRVVASDLPEWVGTLQPTPGEGGISCRDDPGAPAAGPVPRVPALTCSLPIRAHVDERQVLGALSVSWDLVRLHRQLPAEPDVDAGGLVLLSREGRVVLAPPPLQEHLVGRNLVADGSQAAALASAGRRGFLVEAIAGRTLLVGYAHSGGEVGWSALVVQDARTAFAPAGRLRDAVLGVGGFAALLALLLAPVLAARLTRPLRELEAAVHRVEQGDLDLRIEPSENDEIGSLSRSFDRMVRELKRQRAQLVDKAYVDSLVAGMEDGLFVVGATDQVRHANPALCRLLALTEEAVVGRPAGSLFAGREEEFERRILEPARREGSAREVEMEMGGGPGRPAVPVIVSAGRLSSGHGGSRPEVVCMAIDITQHKRAEDELRRAREEAEAAARAKAAFLATLSHEVRTPLTGVLGMADLLAGTRLDDTQRAYVGTARRAAESLLSVFDDLLDYSRMEAGRLELQRSAFDLRECLEETIDLLAPVAREKGLEISVLIDEGLPRRVVGDPSRLRQVLLNLGTNALKFTPAGAVSVRAERVAAMPSMVRVAVSDTGIGIPAEVRERVFEPFFQVDASSTRRHGGTGLGLAIVREIVGLMSGRVDVETEEGRGSTFSFTVELPPVTEARPGPVPSPAALTGLRVLVVDDNAVNRFVLAEMLRSWRCEPEEAADAWECLEKLRAAAQGPRPFRLALLDFQMPEMDGGQLAQEIKADPALAPLPLLLLTSMPQHGEAARVAGLGFSAYLTKPVRQAVLLETIVRVLGAEGPAPRSRGLALVQRPVDEGRDPGD